MERHLRWTQLALGFWPARALSAAAELGVLERLRTAPATAEELAEALALRSSGVVDLLDALAALGVLTRDGDRYSLAADGPDADVVAGLPAVAEAFRRWADLDRALRDGRAAGAAGLFDGVLDDPDRLAAFAEAIAAVSAPGHAAAVSAVDWSAVSTVCDAGGADGRLAVALAATHPHLRCRTVDLPALTPLATARVAAAGLGGRVEVVAADLFADPLPPSDAVVLSSVLLDWDVDAKRALLAAARRALQEGDLLVVVDRLGRPARPAGRSALEALRELDLLVAHGDAHHYTRAELDGWLDEACFTRSEEVARAGELTVLVSRAR